MIDYTIDDLDNFIKIDISNLDVECEIYSENLTIVADVASKAVSIRDGCKSHMEDTYAQLFVVNKENGGSDKLAESNAKSCSDYRDAVKEHLEAKLDADLKLNRKEAMGRKAFMLELLAKLYLSEHFSDVAIRDFQSKVKPFLGEKKKESIAEGRKVFSKINRRRD